MQKDEPRFNVGGRLGGSGSSGGGSGGGGGGGGGLTVLDALEHIKSDIAFNALVNAASPEGCALLRSYDDVDRLVFGPRAPFARAYTPDGTAHFRRGRTTASEPVPKQQRRPQHMAPFLCADRPGDGSDERRAEMLAQSGQQAQVAQRAQAHADTPQPPFIEPRTHNRECTDGYGSRRRGRGAEPHRAGRLAT